MQNEVTVHTEWFLVSFIIIFARIGIQILIEYFMKKKEKSS